MPLWGGFERIDGNYTTPRPAKAMASRRKKTYMEFLDACPLLAFFGRRLHRVSARLATTRVRKRGPCPRSRLPVASKSPSSVAWRPLGSLREHDGLGFRSSAEADWPQDAVDTMSRQAAFRHDSHQLRGMPGQIPLHRLGRLPRASCADPHPERTRNHHGRHDVQLLFLDVPTRGLMREIVSHCLLTLPWFALTCRT